jgi:hypothetical protein
MSQRIEATVHWPRSKTAPTNKGRIRLNVGGVNAMLSPISSGSAACGKGNLFDSFPIDVLY